VIAISRLGPGDAARAVETVRAFKGRSRSASALESFLRNPANYLLVAEAEREPAGFLLAYRLERADRNEPQMFVYEVEVAEAWRRRGVGSRLLDAIQSLARAEGMFEAFVLTNRDNEAARGLYARAGGAVEDDAAMVFVYPMDEESAATALGRNPE
jgi:ribosomal protein S18 acetylase RimI-like enzyme